MTYKWNFACLEAYPEKDEKQNVVFLVHWIFTCDHNHEGKDYFSSCIGTQSLPLPEGDFIPFEDLTEDLIIEWMENEMGERVQAMKDSLAQQIDDQITPKINKLVPPWQN